MRLEGILIIPMLTVIYIILTQPFLNAPFARYLGVALAIGYFVVAASFGHRLSRDQFFILIDKFIKYTVVLLVAECIWRFTHPNTDYAAFAASGDVRWIYQYKFGSFMYADSNATAIHIIILLFFILYLEKEHQFKFYWLKWILVMLLVLTLSRAAWVGAIIGWVYIRYLIKKRIDFYLINFVLLSFAAVFSYKFYFESKLKNDLSFQSKFDIVGKILNYFSNASLGDLAFGIGFSNSLQRLDVYAHNFFMVILIESGFIGLLLILLLFIQFVITTRKKALYILVPFVITTLSSTITFIPYFYVIMALIVLAEKDKTKLSFKDQ